MANLTISVDDEVLKRARIRALERGTSVNAVLAEYLRSFAGELDAQARATRSRLALAAENTRLGGRARGKARGYRFLSGIQASQRHRMSFRDALIVQAAAQSGCTVLLSEDLNAGQVIEQVRVENPFAR